MKNRKALLLAVMCGFFFLLYDHVEAYAALTGKSVDSVRTFCQDDLYGYVDEEGREIVPCRFEYARDFDNGVGTVGVGNFSITAAFNRNGEQLLAFGEDLDIKYYDGDFGIAARQTGDSDSPV